MRSHAKALVAALILLGSLVLGVTFAAGTSPTVAIDPPSDVKFASAHVSGTVDPEDGETRYAFQYAIDPDTEGWSSTDFFSSDPIPAGAGPTPVQADLGGLKPGATYRVRLVASNFVDPDAVSAEETFPTEAVDPPEVNGLLISAISATTAHFEATVNSGGPGPGEASEYRFSCSPECPGIEGFQPFSSDGTDHTVEAEATGLEPNTPYTVTLIAQSAGGQDSDGPESFMTDAVAARALTLELTGPVSDSSARLLGQVDPGNSDTTWQFEYGPTTAYGHTTPLESPLTGNGIQSVAATISGLDPESTYHYRLIADNGVGGIAEGQDETFEAASPVLPENRHYELVTTSDKNQGIVGSGAVAELGGRALILTAGGLEGGGLFTPSIAVREQGGWEMRSLLPPSPERPYQNYGLASYTPDLKTFTALAAPSLLGGIGPSAIVRLEEGNQTILNTFEESVDQAARVQYGDASLSKVYANIRPALDPGHIPGQFNVYDVSQEPPVLISRLPGGSVPPCGVEVGSSGGFGGGQSSSMQTRRVSQDGSRLFFVTRPTCESSRQLYRRDTDLEETTLISGPAYSGPLQEALFLQANAEGSIVYFATYSRLEEADSDELADVYRWSEGMGNVCLTCIADIPANLSDAPTLNSAIAVSADLSRVYFKSPEVLASGGIQGEGNIYVWRVTPDSGPAGEIKYVGVSSKPIADKAELGNQLASDGATLIFTAADQRLNALTGTDNAEFRQLYRYDDRTESLTCVSCPAARPAVTDVSDLEKTGPSPLSSTRVMSDDGSRIAFSTRESLVPADVNGDENVYEWDLGVVSLIGDGQSGSMGAFGDRVLGMSADGTDLLFISFSDLAPGLPDESNQVYDARLGSPPSFPPGPPRGCAGEGCRGPASETQVSPSAGSASFVGGGNRRGRARAVRHCGKGKRKIRSHARTRCVKKRNKQAKTTGGAGR